MDTMIILFCLAWLIISLLLPASSDLAAKFRNMVLTTHFYFIIKGYSWQAGEGAGT